MGGLFASANGVTRNGLARLNGDGSLDAGFDARFRGILSVSALAVQPDGNVLVGGYFPEANGFPPSNPVRLKPDGSTDPTFNPRTGGEFFINDVAVQTDGKLIVAGEFTRIGGVSRAGIVRLNSDGSLDTNFDPGAGVPGRFPRVQVVRLQSDGKVIFGGAFTSVDGKPRNAVARLNSDGSLDSGFVPETGSQDGVGAIAVQPHGELLLGGGFFGASGRPPNGLIRLLADGKRDRSFYRFIGIYGGVSALAQPTDGSLLVAGNLFEVEGQPRFGIARFRQAAGLRDSARAVDGAFSMTVVGELGLSYRIETSTDLRSWAVLTNVSPTAASLRFTDTEIGNLSHRFYRAIAP